jgi:hypothetical protein
VAALDALVKHGLTLIGATHLPRLVVHLLAVALWAVFLHHHLGHLLFLLFCLRVLHPLLPLGELFLSDDLRIYQVPQLSLVPAEAAGGYRRVRLEGQHHSTVGAEHGRGVEGDKGLHRHYYLIDYYRGAHIKYIYTLSLCHRLIVQYDLSEIPHREVWP